MKMRYTVEHLKYTQDYDVIDENGRIVHTCDNHVEAEKICGLYNYLQEVLDNNDKLRRLILDVSHLTTNQYLENMIAKRMAMIENMERTS